MADVSTCPPLEPASISKAYEKIKTYVHQTPLITNKTLDRIASSPDPRSFFADSSSTAVNGTLNDGEGVAPQFRLYFKCENQQKIGAFKARGAFHAVTRLIDELGIDHVREKGVITHSSGNHAQALALAASTFQIPSYIVMPSISTPSKIAGTQAYTENVIFSGSTSTEREAKVAEVVARTGAILVPPYDHPDIILGQGTAGREAEIQFQQLKGSDEARFDAVIAPCGGGGLLSGTATWYSHTHDEGSKKTLVFGAEPSYQGANDIQIGLSKQPPERITHVNSLTIGDGLRTPAGVIPWSIISDKRKVEGVFGVSEDEIKMAMRLMIERVKEFVEPSAVVGLAVILFCREFRELVAQTQTHGGSGSGSGRPWDVAVILSGGNTTLDAISKLFEAKSTNGEQRHTREAAQVGLDGRTDAEDIAG